MKVIFIEDKMPYPYKGELIPRAKELRKSATKQENHLWYDFLKDFPVRFQRQKTISGFIADFYCAKAKLIIEIDGNQHYTDQGLAYDAERSGVLSQYGIEVIRFSNIEIDNHFDFVCKSIESKVEERIDFLNNNPCV